MREKLLVDTLKTMADLVMFTADDERSDLLTKFEKLVEDMMLDEDGMMEECHVAQKMEIESEEEMFKLRFKEGIHGSSSTGSKSRKNTGMMPVSYKEYF